MNVYIVVGLDYDDFEITKVFAHQVMAELYKDKMIENHLKYKEELDAFCQKVKGKSFEEFTNEERVHNSFLHKKYEGAIYKNYEVYEFEVEE